MATTFTLGVGPFPVGTTVGVYSRRTLIGDGGPIGSMLTSAVTSAALTTTFAGLAFETDYWAAAQVSGVWRKVAFTTALDPSSLALTQAALDVETAARTAADSSEATTRAAADTTLSANVAIGGILARKPGSGAGVAFVDPVNGNDTNDGGAWGSAKATIAAAVAAITATGGAVRVSAGTLTHAAAVAIPNFIDVEGQGDSTIISCSGNNYAFAFIGVRASVSNMRIQAAATQSAGGGFDFTSAGSRITLDRIYFSNGIHTGINASPTSSANTYIFTRIFWIGGTGHSFGIKIGGGAGLVTDVYMSDIVGTASTTSDMGTWLTAPSNADTIKAMRVLFIKGATGFDLGATSQITNIQLTDCVADTMTAKGLATQSVRVCEIKGMTISTCGAANVPAVDIGANGQLVKLIGGVIQGCGGYGLILRTGAVHTLIDSLDVIDCNTSNTASNDGIAVGVGASSFKITRCTVGNGVLGAAGHQKTGISVASGASDNYIVAENHCFGNETSNNVIDAGTGINKRIANNTPNAVPVTAAAATTLLPTYSDVHTISGNTAITSITASWPGRIVMLSFTGTPTVTDGSNLKLAGNFVAAGTTNDPDTLTLISDGTAWQELARSVN